MEDVYESSSDSVDGEAMHKVDGLPNLPPVQHAGERVLTTELLARVYGVEEKTLRDNFQDNRNRFVSGIHFFDLTPGELRGFKDRAENSGLVGRNARSLRLWTVRGASRHAKMLSTDQAWAVFGKLEERYFDGPAIEAASSAMVQVTPLLVRQTFTNYQRIAKAIGLDQNQSAIAANHACRKTLGIDALATLGATHLTAPQQQRIVTPSDLGKELGGKSGMAVNSLLATAGLQIGKRDAKDKPYWVPTETGEPYAVWQDTGKRHGDGTPVRQLKWTFDVLDVIREVAS